VADQWSDYADKYKDRVRSNDRVVTLKRMEGKNALNSKGMIDNRLFTGENKLHVTLDSQTGLWSIKFEKGLTPGGLDNSFTSFNKALALIREYYRKRNIEVDKVLE